MSRIYFHSERGTAEVSGRERAYMGTFCSSLLLVSMRLDRSYPSEAPLYRQMVPSTHYTQQGNDAMFLRSFATWLCVGGDRETFGIKTKVDPFTAALNTAVAVGGDAVKLMARLHGQCEIHAYVEGPNRAWLADIIEDGREFNLLRSGLGWESAIELLRSRDDGPVVTSYSVCRQFPNDEIAKWEDDRDGEGFWELPEAERWERAMRGLRESRGGLELKPDNWTDFYFGDGMSGFDVMEEAQSADAVATPVESATPDPSRKPEASSEDERWRTAALLKVRTRRAIGQRVAAGESVTDLATEYGVPVAFVERISQPGYDLLSGEESGNEDNP